MFCWCWVCVLPSEWRPAWHGDMHARFVFGLSGGGGSGRFLIPGGFNGMFRGNRSSFPLTGKNPLVILERGRVPVFGSF